MRRSFYLRRRAERSGVTMLREVPECGKADLLPWCRALAGVRRPVRRVARRRKRTTALSPWPRADLSCPARGAKSLHFRHLRHVYAGDEGAQLLRRLEYRHRPRGYLNRRSGAGISSHAGLSIANLEGAESPDLDVLLRLEGFLDRLEKSVHHTSAILLGNHRPGGS